MESLGLRLQPDPDRLTLPHFLDDVVSRHGPRCAIRFEGESISYDELGARVRELSRALLGAGVVKGARVAIWFANRPEWIVAAFAAARLGAVVIPVNTFATPDERDYILRHSDASLLLMQASLLQHEFLADLARDHPELVSGEPGRLLCLALPQLRRVVCLGGEEGEASGGGVEDAAGFVARGDGVDDALVDALASEVVPGDEGVLIYTSGTTARPKGVLHTQRAPVIQSWRFAELMGLDEEDRVWTAQPLFWTAGIAMSMGAAFAAGATLILEESFEPARALATLSSERATTLFAWPHQEKALAEHPDAAATDWSSVSKVEFSSPLAKLAGLERDAWGTYGSYGLSETFTLASALPASADAELRSRTSGRPLPGTEIRIVDPETGAALPRGEKGEIAVKGATFMRGYHKVAPEWVVDADGFFHTQDAGHLDDEGLLHWSGRLSNLIKTGGANVSPLEIEALASAREDLRVALAVGVPHPTLGEAVILCAVPAAGHSPDEETLRAALREKLATYKLPRRVFFFEAEELEYTGNQKIQVAPLREAALRRLAEEGAEIAGHRY